MSSAPANDAADQLLAQARNLEAEAIRTGEDGKHGRELRAQAAELRAHALGARTYAVLTCRVCSRITGWTDATGTCERCLRQEQLESAYSDPHGGWVDLVDTRQPETGRGRAPLTERIAALIGGRKAHERASRREWLALVDPDQSGPISPEAGYTVEVAKRDEVAAPDGSGNMIIRFVAATYRYDGSRWQRLDSTRIGSSDILVPAEFSAGLPIEQLAEAWVDYGTAVHAFNRRAWRREDEARENERQSQKARADALGDQQNVAEFLREER